MHLDSKVVCVGVGEGGTLDANITCNFKLKFYIKYFKKPCFQRMETDSHYEELPPGAAQHHRQTYFHIEHGKSESRLQLQRLVARWAERRPDVCLLSSDNQRVFSHRSLLSLHSRTLFSVLHPHHLHDELPILSVPAPGRAVRCLLRLLTAGVVVAHSKEDLREAERAAAVLGVQLHNTVTQRIKIPSSEMLSYNKQPVMSKFIGIKPNIIDICDPCTDNADILDVLDEEIEAGENAVNSSSDIQLLPSAKKFKSKMFTERLQKLKDSGTDFQVIHQSKPEYSTGCCKTSGQLCKLLCDSFLVVFFLFFCSFDCQIWAIFHSVTLWA